MRITCGSCAAKYTVSDEKVQGKTVKVKCKKCGAVIVVSSTGEVKTTGGDEAAAAGAMSFTVSVTDNDQRNMSMTEIVDAYNDGIIDAETFVWAEGMDDWQPLKDVEAIVDALHEAAEAEPAPEDDFASTVAMDGASLAAAAAGAAADDDGGGPLGSTVAMSSPLDAGPAAAAPADAGGGFDAGGGLGSLGSEPAPAADAASNSDGFFDFGGSPDLSAGASAGSGGGNVGGGEENSAIFSLNMLTQKVASDDGPSATTEDSGLIDLKALAAGVGNESEEAAPAAAPAAEGVFPLGAPVAAAPAPPPVASPSMAPAAAPASSNRGLILGLGAVIVALLGVVVFFVVKGSEPPPAPAASATPPVPAPAPTPTAEPEPKPEPSAVASADASAKPEDGAEDDKTDKPAATVAGGTRPPPPTTTKPTPRPTTARPPKPPPAPKPTAGPCGCNPNDLMCVMRCTNKK